MPTVPVRLDEDTHRAFKAHCAMLGTGMSAYFRDAIREALTPRPPSPIYGTHVQRLLPRVAEPPVPTGPASPGAAIPVRVHDAAAGGRP